MKLHHILIITAAIFMMATLGEYLLTLATEGCDTDTSCACDENCLDDLMPPAKKPVSLELV